MGVPWSEDDFGNNCGCWEAGHTPARLFVSFAGISSCPLAGLLPAPPNGIFELLQDGAIPCKFSGGLPNFTIRWNTAGGNTNLTADTFPPFLNIFGSFVARPCIFFLTSGNDCAGWPFDSPYRGGVGIVLSIGNAPYPSMQSIAELMNLAKDEFSFCDFWPIDENQISIRYARQRSPTNILIKVDFSEFDQYAMLERD